MKKIFLMLLAMQVSPFVLADGLNAINDPVMNPCIQRPDLAGCSGNSQSGGQARRVINYLIVGARFITMRQIELLAILKIILKGRSQLDVKHWQAVSKREVAKIQYHGKDRAVICCQSIVILVEPLQ